MIQFKRTSQATVITIPHRFWRPAAIVAAVLASSLFFFYAAKLIWSPMVEGRAEFFERDEPLKVWNERAKDLNISYEDCKKQGQSCVGKPVLWKVLLVYTGETAYYEGENKSFLRVKGYPNLNHIARALGGDMIQVIGAVSSVSPEIELIVLGFN